MTKRGRWRLIIVLIVLGVPLLVCLGVVAFVASGGLEHRLEREYAARFPGRLEIGRIELAGADRALAHDLLLYGPSGGEPVVRISQAELQGGLFPPRLSRIIVKGLALRFDRDGVEFVRAFLALPRPESTSAGHPPIRLDVDGEIAVGQRMVLSPLRLSLNVEHWSIDGKLDAMLGGKPFNVRFAPEPGGDPLRRSSRIRVEAATVDLGDLFGAITALGFLPDQAPLLAWLPEQASIAGADLVVDPAARTVIGRVSPTWAGGSGDTRMRLDSEGLHLTQATADDAKLGKGTGSLDVTIPDGVLTVQLERWQPGPRIPLPSAVPTASLLALLPAARMTLHPEGTRVSLWCLPAGGAMDGQRVELRWRRNAPLEIEAVDLPMQLVQGFVPNGLRCTAGVATSLSVEWEDQLQRLVLRLRDAELQVGAWRLSGIDGQLDTAAIDPHDAQAGYVSRLDLPFGAAVHRGTGRAGDLEITVAQIDQLVARLHGTVPLPRLSGLLKVVGRAENVDGVWRISVKHLGVAGVSSQGALREVTASGAGNFTWNGSSLNTVLNGQLVSGEALLPSGWLDLCLHQPLFTTTFSVDGKGVRLQELLARASDKFGQPAPQGFTAGLTGNLDSDFSGRIDAVVDRLDLGWFSRSITAVPLPPETTVKGESALTTALSIERGAVQRVDGWVLPLGIDLSLLGKTIEVSGISGSVRFSLVRPSTSP